MSFGLNRAEMIGRLGADVTVNHLTSGGRVANMSIATDEGYLDRNSGDRVDKTEWHRAVTFQDGLIDMLEKHAKKGRLVYVAGKMQTRRFRKDGEDSDRFSTEILLVPGSRIQFLDKANGANGNDTPAADAAGPRTVRPCPRIRTIRSRSRDDLPSFLPPNSGAGASALAPFLVRASSLHRSPGRPAAATVSVPGGIFSLPMRVPTTAPFRRRSWLCTCSTVAGLRSGR